jgi:hypothetical protein
MSPEFKISEEKYGSEMAPFILDSGNTVAQEKKRDCLFPTVVIGMLAVIYTGVMYTAARQAVEILQY